MGYLQGQYPALYNNSIDYVAFYNGSFVGFQTPQGELPKGSPNPVYTATQIDPAARFFLVALDDPSQDSYETFDPSVVADIHIYTKGNELAQIIWQIKTLTGAPRVIVVAHSMGGLDTRAYIEGLASPTGSSDAAIPYFNDIAALITLDTPHGGAVSAEVDGYETWFDACSDNPSIDKSEMIPSGIDSSSGTNVQSIIPEINYNGGNAKQLPSDLTITSISSFWNIITPLFIPLPGFGSDNVLYSQEQDLGANLANQILDSQSTLNSVSNSFGDSGYLIGPLNGCGITAPLHQLTCTGSATQTFSLIEAAALPSASASSGPVQINPAAPTVGSGGSLSFTATTGSSTIWSILEGGNGGNITSDGTYQAPVNHTALSEPFHVVAINSQNPSQYAVVPIEVTSSTAKSPTTTVLTTSATQVPIGASLTINATVQTSGGTPTGTVTFYDGGNALSPAILNNAGEATYSTSSLTLGFHSITAKYGGDSNYTGSTSSAVSVAVVAIDPQLSVSPANGTPGVTSFLKTDMGFTPYGLITHTATFPDNSVSVLQTYADGNGEYSYSRTYTEIGTYTQIDTDGTSGETTKAASWTVSTSATNDFSLQMSPSTQTLNQGSSVTYTVITATSSGLSQSIALSATNLPTGVSASFSSATVTSGNQSILTLSASSSASTGTYTVTLIGVGTTTHTATFSVTVAQAAQTAGALSSSPLSFTFNSQTIDTASAPFVFSLVNTGGTALTISSITESPQLFASLLNGQGLPLTLQPNGSANMQVVFIPNATGQQTGTIKLFNTTNASPLTLNVSGTGVAAPVTTGNIQINATFNGAPWAGTVYYNLTGPESYTGGTAPNTYYNTAPGSYTLAYAQSGPFSATFTGVTPSATQSLSAGATVTYTLNFTGSNTFAVGDTTPTSAIMGAGTSTQFAIDLCILTGATQSVNMTVSGLPSNATASFAPNPASVGCSGAASTATVTTSTSTPPGIYSLVFIGTNQDGYSTSNTLHTPLTVDVPPVSPTQVVSLSNSGTQGNGQSGALGTNDFVSNAVSGNGRFVAFLSSATNLVQNDTNSQQDIFVRDLQLGTTTRVSVASNGTQADNESLLPSISWDGQYVSFSSLADNLVAGSVPGQQGVYLHDMTSGTTTRLDLAPNGTVGNNTACCSSVSDDGRFIAFASAATNLMAGVSGENVYRYDMKTQLLSLASVASDGVTVGGGTSPQISADGRFVAFTSYATNLVTGVTNGKNNAFVHDFVTGQTVQVNVASDGTPDNCGILFTAAIPVSISADGRYLAFISCGNTLVPGLANPYEYYTAYIHDMNTGQTSALSADPQNNAISVGNMGTLSADGRFVSFGSTYLEDRTTGDFTLLNVAADGSGGNGAAYVATISMDGSSAVFSSDSTNLVANDTNTNSDVFSFANPFLSSPRANSLTLGVSQAPGGSQVAGTITLNAPAPTGGTNVAVWSNNSAAQPPAEVLVPAGATSASFTIPTVPVSSETVMTIIASYNGGSEVSLLTLEPAPQLSVSPGAWDFGYQAVGSTSAIESFALTNSGTAALALNSVQLGTGQVFKISSNTCGSSITAGGSCSVSVSFDPSASGAASDAVQISYGSPVTTFSISLTGNGATPVAALSPGPLNFGSQSMPGSSTAVATLTNSGNASLSSISASISGTNAGDFSISSDGCSGVTLPANSSCLITVSFSPKAKGTRVATLSIADSASGSPQTASLSGVGVQSTPTVLWTPSAASLTYGSPLGTGILNATANASGNSLGGTFAYAATVNGGAPQAVTQSTVLGAGSYALTATFTPTDTTDYTTATATVALVVNQGVPVITWATPAAITYGAALSASQLDATSSVAGTFAYSPAAGTVLSVGSHNLTATFTPTDTVDYVGATGSVTLAVTQATPTITWGTPAAITYGTALSAAQLDATASVAGTFSYSPAVGTVPKAGSETLTVAFAPNDSTDYATATATVTLVVNRAPSTLSWAAPAAIVYGTALGATQLDATASVPGSFAYSPVAGTILPVGNDMLSVSFTPTDSTDYAGATASVTLSVNNPLPVVGNTSPAYTSAGSAAFTLTVNGTGFMPNSAMYWGSSSLTTQFVSATQLTAQIPASDVATAGTTAITVQTPTPGGGTSNSLLFEVDSAGTGTTPPTFTTVTATVAPGTSATYPVTLPSSATFDSVNCLNLPSGAQCSYSSGTLTITTSSTTPAGTYQITVVFTETLPGAATAFVILPILLLPLLFLRKKLGARGFWFTTCLGLILMTAAALSTGCGGGSSGGGSTPPQTHKVTSSGSVSLTVQ